MLNTAFISGWSFQAGIAAHCLPKNTVYLDYPDFHDPLHSCQTMAKQLTSPCQLVAWSLGGLFAIKLAQLFPEKIRALCLINSCPYFSKAKHWPGIHQTNKTHFIKEIVQKKNIPYFLKLACYPHIRHLQQQVRPYLSPKKSSFWLPYLELLFSWDLRQTYQRLTQPIIHIHSSKDAIIQCDKKALQALQPYSQHHDLQNASHLPFFSHGQIISHYITANNKKYGTSHCAN